MWQICSSKFTNSIFFINFHTFLHRWRSPKAVPVPWHSATLISLALSFDSIIEVLVCEAHHFHSLPCPSLPHCPYALLLRGSIRRSPWTFKSTVHWNKSWRLLPRMTKYLMSHVNVPQCYCSTPSGQTRPPVEGPCMLALRPSWFTAEPISDAKHSWHLLAFVFRTYRKSPVTSLKISDENLSFATAFPVQKKHSTHNQPALQPRLGPSSAPSFHNLHLWHNLKLRTMKLGRSGF